jgi:hypothetical protein
LRKAGFIAENRELPVNLVETLSETCFHVVQWTSNKRKNMEIRSQNMDVYTVSLLSYSMSFIKKINSVA